MSRAVVRVLFGQIKKFPRARREVCGSLVGSVMNEWMRDNAYHFVLGDVNYKLLKSKGVKNLIKIDNKRFIFTPQNDKTNMYANKVYLMNKAMEQFDEILFADFDAVVTRIPDKNMWDIIYKKKGKFNGDFQTLNVGYKRPICLIKKHGGIRRAAQHPIRHGLNTSVVYCRDKNWLQEWMDVYLSEKQKKIYKGTGTDEHILMYYLDQKYGIFSIKDMVGNFEIEIAELSRTIPMVREMGKNKKNIYFSHY